jgi:hypothetical protein
MILEAPDDSLTVGDGGEGQVPAQLLGSPAVQESLEHLVFRHLEILASEHVETAQGRRIADAFHSAPVSQRKTDTRIE